MCYSAQIKASYHQYLRVYGADMDLDSFAALFWSRLDKPRIKLPRALEVAFGEAPGASTLRIAEAIQQYRAQQATELEQEIFKQRQRLILAERTLLAKTTKAALESRRIASAKIDWALGRLADQRRTQLTHADARIYPGYYAPVMVMEQGRRVLKPMRYQCRPAGKPATFDAKFPGTYNARRDNLEGFWRGQFGYTHGLMVVSAFYEHVALPQADGEPQKTILEFRPRPEQDMLVACLWSRWRGPGEPDLLSFAAITDEPPPEVAAAGHDRCIIPIKPEHIDAWLNPRGQDLQALYALLDDRQRPYYEHRLAA